jgi:hypothetical protein
MSFEPVPGAIFAESAGNGEKEPNLKEPDAFNWYPAFRFGERTMKDLLSSQPPNGIVR